MRNGLALQSREPVWRLLSLDKCTQNWQGQRWGRALQDVGPAARLEKDHLPRVRGWGVVKERSMALQVNKVVFIFAPFFLSILMFIISINIFVWKFNFIFIKFGASLILLSLPTNIKSSCRKDVKSFNRYKYFLFNVSLELIYHKYEPKWAAIPKLPLDIFSF